MIQQDQSARTARRLDTEAEANYRVEVSKLDSQVLWRITAMAFRHRGRMAVALISTVLAGGFQLFVPQFLGRAVDQAHGDRRGDRKDDPTARLDGPSPEREVPDVLSREEVSRLIAACEDDKRLKCLVELLYGAGLRASELVTLRVGNLPRRKAGQWMSADIIIRGKGGKDRLCPLGRAALIALSEWLDVREGSLPDNPMIRSKAEGFVFPSRGKEGHLTRRRLGQMLEELAAKAGLRSERVYPHALRHAYATHLLQGGADLRVVQTLLGHADIATTQIYTHVLTDELAELLETAHPMAAAPKGRR